MLSNTTPLLVNQEAIDKLKSEEILNVLQAMKLYLAPEKQGLETQEA